MPQMSTKLSKIFLAKLRRWDQKPSNTQLSLTNTRETFCLIRRNQEGCYLVPEKVKKDIIFAHDNVKRFAEAQLSTMQDVELEVVPGLIAGQKSIPVNTAGCYIPGGRYSHIASAIMTVTTAKVAGCQNIIAKLPTFDQVKGLPQQSFLQQTNVEQILFLRWVESKVWQQ